jgi:hypothetical protein
MTKPQTLINKINKAMPKALAAPSADFYGDNSKGIWLRGSEDFAEDGARVFNYYNDDNLLHPKLEKIIKDAGWYAEPYDSGTCMIWPI